MDVVVIPTHMPMIRADYPDVVYRTEAAKYRAIVRAIKESYDKGQPVLVGTVSIEKSELISQMLKKIGVKHNVLNAKYHEQEAAIIADAGQANAVTIATNMAGRGTDIMLGAGVVGLGGLRIIGTERHESRRIDNQLRGRAGRQGDPGESRFYISMEDELMRLFGSERMMRIVDTLGMEEDDEIEHGMLSKAIENAQKKVEGNNFGTRKHLLEYDQVMNEQREIIYGERNKVINGVDLRDSVMSMVRAVIGRAVDLYTGADDLADEWDYNGLNDNLMLIFHKPATHYSDQEKENLTKDDIKEDLIKSAVALYELREAQMTPERTREVERVIMMRVIDQKWMDHIDDMDRMRQGINLRAYAQRDPLIEYKFMGYEMFDEMSQNIQLDTVRGLFNVTMVSDQQPQMQQAVKKEEMFTNTNDDPQAKKPVKRADDKIGRNDPCPCGSGRKFKQCCINKKV
jgi:preprotein translocase subunit SecA